MVIFALIAVAAAALFVRLGIWQLDRLHQRRARNAVIASRITAAPALWSDSTAVPYRRVRLSGTPDYAHEIILVGRSREGSPGVNLVTPFRLAGSDKVVLVNRGWVYSPDATEVEQPRWREGDSVTIEGYVEAFDPPGPGDLPAHQWIARRLSLPAISARLPYAVAPTYVVALGTGTSFRTPARAALPTPDNGPHLGYAIQWFSFAAIAIVGTGIAIATGRRDRTVGHS